MEPQGNGSTQLGARQLDTNCMCAHFPRSLRSKSEEDKAPFADMDEVDRLVTS